MTTQQLWPWHMWKIRTSISGGKTEWGTAITSFHGIGWGEEAMGQQCPASFREAGIYHLPCLLKSQVIFSKQIICPAREEMMLKERYHHMDRMFFATLEAGWQWCLSDSPQPDFQQQVHKLLSQFLSIRWNHWFLPAVQKPLASVQLENPLSSSLTRTQTWSYNHRLCLGLWVRADAPSRKKTPG